MGEQLTERQAVAAGEAKLAAANEADTASANAASRPKPERMTPLMESVELKRLQFDNANLHVELLRQMLNGLERFEHEAG